MRDPAPALIDAAYYAAIREERDQLAERVRQLEVVLFETEWIPGRWRLRWSGRLILNVLALRSIATNAALLGALAQSETAHREIRNDFDTVTKKNLHVQVFKLRRDLAAAKVPVTIETVPGVGFRLDDAGRLYLTMLMREFAA